MPPTYTVTFYSFKGGVGRTTLLANVASELAAGGARVLVWDLDVEAPGLHLFPGFEPPERMWQGGFLEWLGDTPPAPAGLPAAWPDDGWLRALGDRVYPAPQHADDRLRVLPAHGSKVDLGAAYAAIDWHALLVEQPERALQLFVRVRDALAERFRPTFLFIDARTGVSDLGGLLTGYLPDCTVLVGNYSRQSTAGLSSIYLGLDRFASAPHLPALRRRHPLERLLVASPVPTAPALMAKGRAQWETSFPGVAPRSQIEVPLAANLLYAEDLLVRSAPSSDAAQAYRAVAAALTDLQRQRERSEERARDADGGGEGAGFEARAERVLRLLGFELQPRTGVDLIARQRTGVRDLVYQVRCHPGEAPADTRLGGLVQGLRDRSPPDAERLLLVGHAHDGARARAARAGVTLRTIEELEAQLVDLPALASVIVREFEASELARAYVPPRLADGRDALRAAVAWATGEGAPLALVIGDDGAGKTSFTRRLAYELVDQAARDPQVPLPLLVSLRQAGAGVTLEDLIQRHLREAIGWHGNPEAVLHLVRAGRVVLLLDGFDELTGISSSVGALEQLWLLARPIMLPSLAPAGNRVLITCRTRFLREHASTPGATEGGRGDLPAIAALLDPTTIELAPFDPPQIARFLENKLGPRAAAPALAAIRRNERASTLAQRPLFLSIMAEDTSSLDGTDDDVTTARLCQHRVEAWVARGAPTAVLSADQRAKLIEWFAAEVWQLTDQELPHELLAGILRKAGGALGELATAPIDHELRTAPFLARSAEGSYRFVHQLYLSYCVARHLANQAARGPDALGLALATERIPSGVVEMFVEIAAERARRGPVESALRAILDAPYQPAVTDNAARLHQALGAQRVGSDRDA